MSRLFAIGHVLVISYFAAMPLAAQSLEIKPEERLIAPWRGLAYPASQVAEVRRLALEVPENALTARAILSKAEEWLARDDETIRALIPKPGAAFAHGFAGDPKTGQPWPRFAHTDEVCRLDRPGEVRSPFTGDVYGIQKPGEPYYDDGNGWVRPEDGRPFYFKAIWNSYVADQLHDAIDHLALAYLLTGEERVAAKALFIMEELATLRAKTPEYRQLIDSVRKVDRRVAFFRYQGNIANQRACLSALSLDLLANAPAALAPSSYDPSRSVRDHIAHHYFDLYEREYYLDSRGALTNHGSILFANVIAQGVLFGDPGKLRTGIDALYSFIDSTVNRDGDYMELAGGYGRLGRDYGSRLVALLQHYDPAHYSNSAEMPRREDYPFSLRIADDPRWYSMVVGMLYQMTAAGRYPQYGDVTPDQQSLRDANNRYLDIQRDQYLRLYYEQTSREEWKQEIRALYASEPPKLPEEPKLTENLLLYGVSQWKPLPPPAASSAEASSGRASDLLGGKGVAILRSGERPHRRALFIRGGANGAHGHDDQMAIVPYGHGMVLTGVYGYASSETPDHVGWGTRAIAHLSATVNQDLPYSYLYKGFGHRLNTKHQIASIPPATITAFSATAPAQFVEMRNPHLWRHTNRRQSLKDYRRGSWLIDLDEEHYYFVDLFQIHGGQTHDYPWNAMWAPGSEEERFSVEGVDPQPQAGAWTLAGLDPQWRSAAWNQPGKSWGERLDGKAAGRILPLPGEKEGDGLVGQRHPPAEPGNGYGMIWDIRTAHTSDDWKATWRLQDQTHQMRAWLVNFDGMEAITGKSPTLLRKRHHAVAIARREAKDQPLASRFVNVVEVAALGAWKVQRVRRLPTPEGDPLAVAIGVDIAGGGTDTLLSFPTPGTWSHDGLHYSGRLAHFRRGAQGEFVHLIMQEGKRFQTGNMVIEAEAAQREVVIREVDTVAGEWKLDGLLPGVKRGDLVRVKSKAATLHDEAYRVESVTHGATGTVLRFAEQSVVLARTEVDSVDADTHTITTRWPSEVAGLTGVAYLDGRGIAKEGTDKPEGHVRSFSRNRLVTDSAGAFQKGDRLQILAAEAGDSLVIPSTVSLRRLDRSRYEVVSNVALTFRLPEDAETVSVTLAGKAAPLSLKADEKGLFHLTAKQLELNLP